MCCSAMGGGGSGGASGLRGARAPAGAVADAGAAARASAIEKRVKPKSFVPARQVDNDVREAPRLELCLEPGIRKYL